MNRAIEDEQLKIKDEIKITEYIMHFPILSLIRHFSKNIFQIKIKISRRKRRVSCRMLG